MVGSPVGTAQDRSVRVPTAAQLQRRRSRLDGENAPRTRSSGPRAVGPGGVPLAGGGCEERFHAGGVTGLGPCQRLHVAGKGEGHTGVPRVPADRRW